MRVPDDVEIRGLHERFAPTPAAFALVHSHCVVVAAVAQQLVHRGGLDVEADLVRAGCLLHDLGVYRLYGPDGRLDHDRYLRHGLLGEELLRELGYPDRLARFCSHHTGVGLTREDVVRQHLPLPVADYLAETREEELVMYADTFHSKSDPPSFVPAALTRVRLRRFGADKVERFAAMAAAFGEPDLERLSSTFGYGVRQA